MVENHFKLKGIIPHECLRLLHINGGKLFQFEGNFILN